MKPKKLLSFVLAMVMLVIMLPTVALATQLQITSIQVLGNWHGWNFDNIIESMTETQPGVYELTYYNMNPSMYNFRFFANRSFDFFWGGNSDSENAIYDSYDLINFEVEQSNSDLKFIFDLRNFDYETKEGAIYKLYINGVQVNGSPKNITLGTSALSGYDSTNNKYKYVYYGTYQQNEYTPTTQIENPQENTVYTDTDTDETKFIYRSGNYYKYEPIMWLVLDMAYKYDKTDLSKTGMLVLSENALANTEFGTNSTWSGSTAQNWCNSMYNSSFGTGDGTKEQDFILGTTSMDGILSNDHLFFLSKDEANKTEYFPKKSNRVTYLNSNKVTWWLRSPYDDTFFVDHVKLYGDIEEYYVTSTFPMAHPAFNLNPASVLFTSVADGKSVTDGTLSANAKNTGNEYKLTMHDTSREFSVTEKSAKGTKGETITFNYDEAKTDPNEYISAMIVDKPSGDVLYYGQLPKVTSKKGTVDFKIPSDIACGTYELRLFNEQINGNYKTDFSSDFEKITLNVVTAKASFSTEPTAKTGLVFNNTDQDLIDIEGASSEGTVKYSLSENGTYSTDIPKGKNADTYTVWYYVEGDTNHTNSDKKSISVTIAKADNSFTKQLSIAGWTYGEKANKPEATAVDGIVTFKYSNSENGTYTDDVPKNAGEYYVKAIVAEGANYKALESAPVKFTIAKATPVESKKVTASVQNGKALKSGSVSEGEFTGVDGNVLTGKLSWVDGSDFASGSGTKKMKFKPENENYSEVEFDVEVSTYSVGGGSVSGSAKASYTISFETNGGSKIVSKTVKKNETLSEPTAPEKEGYIFAGWYTDSEFKNEYDFDTKVTKSFTLYAKWEDEAEDNSIILTIGEKIAMVFGEEVENNVAPIIVNDRTMLPIRFVAEALGGEVEWNEESRTVTIVKDDIEILITIDSDVATVNGEKVKLDSPAFIRNDRTYLPIRFVAENLGATVEWDENARTVTITK